RPRTLVPRGDARRPRPVGGSGALGRVPLEDLPGDQRREPLRLRARGPSKLVEQPMEYQQRKEVRHHVPKRVSALARKADALRLAVPALTERPATVVLARDYRVLAVVEQDGLLAPALRHD